MSRIAMISLHTCPFERLGMYDAGGMNVYIANLSRSLARIGWEVDIFTRTHAQTHEKPCCKEKGIQVIHVPIENTFLPKEQLIKHAEAFAKHIMRHIQTNATSYDLLHAHYYLSGLAALAVKERMRIPVIQTFHTLSKLKRPLGDTDDKARFQAEHSVAQNADTIIASTPMEKNGLIRFYAADPKKIYIVSPGVDTRLFYPKNKQSSRKQLKLDENKPIILFVGRIDPIKDIATLIHAASILAEKHEGFTDQFSVRLIGGDIATQSFWEKPEVQKIQRLIKQKSIDCCVQFVGAVPHDLLPTWFSASDVVVLPSLYESFGLVILEAMACGTVPIASKVGGLKFIIDDGKNGLLFPSQNAKALAEKIWWLFENEQLRRGLGHEAVVKAGQYSWEKQVKQFERLYAYIVTRKHLQG